MAAPKALLVSSAFAFLAAFPVHAQQPAAPAAPLVYGAPITLDTAKKAVAAAEAEARRNNWNVMIVLLDSGGHMVMSQRLDGTQYASMRIAEGKARTALEFK